MPDADLRNVDGVDNLDGFGWTEQKSRGCG